MFFAIFTFLYCVFIIFDLLPILKSKKYKVFWIYSIILTASYVIQICLVFEVAIPSPNVGIIKIINSLLGIRE